MRSVLIVLGLAAYASTAAGQVAGPAPLTLLAPAPYTRVADPKLAGGGFDLAYKLPAGLTGVQVAVEVFRGTTLVATPFHGSVNGQAAPIHVTWNGKDGSGLAVDPGRYEAVIHVTAPGSGVLSRALRYPLDVVRLGIREIEARNSGAQTDEFPLVYYRKGTTYAFFVTPAIHEYFASPDAGDLADLDLNNGAPRPAPAVNVNVAEPPLEGVNYEDDNYNFPLCYLVGRAPTFGVRWGTTSVSNAGAAIALAAWSGGDIRGTVSDAQGSWTSDGTNWTPGGVTVFSGPALPAYGTRVDRTLTWKWQYRATGETQWSDIPGAFTTSHRFYTVIGTPLFAPNQTAAQYKGPWVEVVDDQYLWGTALNVQPVQQHEAMDVVIRGFFGQNGGLATAIEGVIYDAYPVGGDGGASHYWTDGGGNIALSRLLFAHANGKYVNCSDCAGATCVMASMLGVSNVKMLRLGAMSLKAIWGIGTPAYTTNLWGGGAHSFSYHHILTRDGAITVSDACMDLDEDGNPLATPGIPGWNVDRPWAGTGGYNDLSATNTVSKTVEVLPKMN